ncbi:hypothetical protein CFP56_023307 [Quercus suber]|uniref:Neprosin activation peptide domain-containing protein n=1 Tax=Quercus suber TaxID=58331 RepID=A0AAW0K993_QUESU
MAYVINDKLECFIFFLFALSYVLGDRFVDGRRIETLENKGLIKQKGSIKTIEGEDGDTIDCVDIYQQPTFDHPFLKNHIIQVSLLEF